MSSTSSLCRIPMKAWPGVRLEATSTPTALALTASIKTFTTGSATSASSSATRTSSRVSVTFSSLIRPLPRRFSMLRARRAVKLSNMQGSAGEYFQEGFDYRGKLLDFLCTRPLQVPSLEPRPGPRSMAGVSRYATHPMLFIRHGSRNAVAQPISDPASGSIGQFHGKSPRALADEARRLAGREPRHPRSRQRFRICHCDDPGTAYGLHVGGADHWLPAHGHRDCLLRAGPENLRSDSP